MKIRLDKISKNGKYRYQLEKKFDERKPLALIECSDEEIADINERRRIVKECEIDDEEYLISFINK